MQAIRNMKKWKKVLLLIFTVIVIIRIGFVAFRGEIDKEYITSAQYDLTEATRISCAGVSQTFISNSGRMNSLELVFDNIAVNEVGIITIQILKGEELVYQTNLTLSNVNNMEWKRVFVNAEIQKGETYRIVLTPSETCTQIPNLLVVNDGTAATEIRQSVSNEQIIEGQIAINYGYLRAPGIFDRLSIISLWVILWLIVVAILINLDKIYSYINVAVDLLKKQVKPQVLLTLLEVIGCFIIINCSGITFQAPTQVVLYLISLIATINYLFKFEYTDSIASSGWKKVLLVILYFYAAFALVGQRILIYPLTIKLTAAGLFVFVCTVLWFIPIVNSVIFYIGKLKRILFLSKKKSKTWQFIIISVCLLVLPALYNLFANNPGISSFDTVVCMIFQAQHLYGSGDWHPAFYCMVLRAIETVWNSTYAVIFVQYFFWTYVCLEMTLYLRKKGINEIVLLGLTIFLGFNAGNYLYLNTIWKDIPYTLSVFWSITILAKLLIDYEEYKRKWYIYLELIVSLVGMSLYRKNGIVPYVIIMVSLVIILRKNVKVWISVIITIALFGVIKGPIYAHFDIQPVESGMYIGLSQDILGVYYAGGEVSEDTLQMINVMTNFNNAEYTYTPTWSDQSYALDIEAKEFIFNYIDTFLKNPLLMSRAIIDREDAIWDIFAGKDSILGCVNYHETMDDDETWRENYKKRQFVSLYNISSAASYYTVATQWIAAIEWRCGLFTLLGIIAALFMFWSEKKGKYILLLAPAIGHILGLLLSTGWSDFRYFWPLNLLNLTLIFIVFVITKDEDKTIND